MDKTKQAKETPPAPKNKITTPPIKEIGGPKGAEPTRFGDWELKGKCVDF